MLGQQRLQPPPRKPAQLDVGHRFGRVRVGIVEGDAEKIAGSKESGDLPAPIGQELIELHCTGDDVEEILGRLAFNDGGLPSMQGQRRDDAPDMLQLSRFEGAANPDLADFTIRARFTELHCRSRLSLRLTNDLHDGPRIETAIRPYFRYLILCGPVVKAAASN